MHAKDLLAATAAHEPKAPRKITFVAREKDAETGSLMVMDIRQYDMPEDDKKAQALMVKQFKQLLKDCDYSNEFHGISMDIEG